MSVGVLLNCSSGRNITWVLAVTVCVSGEEVNSIVAQTISDILIVLTFVVQYLNDLLLVCHFSVSCHFTSETFCMKKIF